MTVVLDSEENSITKPSKASIKNDIDSEQDLYKLTNVNIDSEENSITKRSKPFITKIETFRELGTQIRLDYECSDSDDSLISDDERVHVKEIISDTMVNLVNKESSKEKGNRRKRFSDESHILVIPGNPEKYKCNICHKIFLNKKNKSYHDACVTGIKPYKCNICDRTFVKHSHFEYHERTHTGYKPYKCDICDKAFPQQNKLKRHMISHTDKKPFECHICEKKYRKHQDLKNHLKTHTDSDLSTCTVCNKTFKCSASLTLHMKTHSDIRPYQCDQCSKSFKINGLLTRHKKTHQKDKPFTCDKCNKVFVTKFELRRHIITHTEDRPYSCKHCGTVFRRKDNLRRHLSHHHMETSTIVMNKVSNESNKSELKTKNKLGTEKEENLEHKKKRKKKQKSMTNVIPKYPDKVSIGVTNSREQINSRLDPMGNITPIIRTTSELSNAVPVIYGPTKKSKDKTENKKTFTYTEPIPLAEAVVINRRIEEKLYPQNTSRHDYYLSDYLDIPYMQHHTMASTSTYANPCMRNNNSNLNDPSSESTVTSEATFTCQTAESGDNLVNTEEKKQEQANYVITIKKTRDRSS
ncbi:PREDICTED: zinc finger protein 836-like [Polistes dominula]|uniref:Zinc finger protein 836-like n=1 Tax=Polistes dominula TaxID=743375 RepID=A0ABM1HX67_POLDO|nr:PREDICTED: zinc finger protein 836-like [Polistes dominula]